MLSFSDLDPQQTGSELYSLFQIAWLFFCVCVRACRASSLMTVCWLRLCGETCSTASVMTLDSWSCWWSTSASRCVRVCSAGILCVVLPYVYVLVVCLCIGLQQCCVELVTFSQWIDSAAQTSGDNPPVQLQLSSTKARERLWI